jgi:hypothetical protein
MSSKVSSIVNKLGTLDEFTETVRQLNSAASLPKNLTFNHPWASPPASAAAQGAVNLAARLRASKDPSVREQYWKAACLSPLVNNLLSSKDIDKVHAALLALSAISDNCDNQEILDELVQLDTIPVLLTVSQSEFFGEGARMTAASVLRNIVGKTKSYKDEFVRAGGLPAIVKLLDFDPDRAADHQYTQWILERVNDLRDYMEEQSGKVDPVVAKAVVALDVRSKLENLKDSKDNDIIEDSIDILNLLADH